jgi:hypothetical protein
MFLGSAAAGSETTAFVAAAAAPAIATLSKSLRRTVIPGRSFIASSFEPVLDQDDKDKSPYRHP